MSFQSKWFAPWSLLLMVMVMMLGVAGCENKAGTSTPPAKTGSATSTTAGAATPSVPGAPASAATTPDKPAIPATPEAPVAPAAPATASTPPAPATAPAKPDAPPPALTHYKGRQIANFMTFHAADWLTRTEREQEESSAEMVKALNIQPGQVVCDMGCGNGYYSLWMAKLVGEKGRVVCVDIQQEMLDMLAKRAAAQSIGNLELVRGRPHDPNLKENSLDLILLVDVYHEFSHPEQMLRAMHKALKPGGRIALVEFRKEDPKVPIKLDHKMSKEQILKEYRPAGFKLVEQYDKLPWQHLMFFQRTDGPLPEITPDPGIGNPVPKPAPVPDPGVEKPAPAPGSGGAPAAPATVPKP